MSGGKVDEGMTSARQHSLSAGTAMHKFISSTELDAQNEKKSKLSKVEREWERVRSIGIGESFTSDSSSLPSSTPSLYDQLKQKEEESATEEEERQRSLGLPKGTDEDELKFFEEQKLRELEDERRLKMQLEQFKREAAQKKATSASITTVLPVSHVKKSSTFSITRPKITPIAKITPVSTASDPTEKTASLGNLPSIVTVSASSVEASNSNDSQSDIHKGKDKKRPHEDEKDGIELPNKKAKTLDSCDGSPAHPTNLMNAPP